MSSSDATTVRVRMISTTNGAPDPGTHTYEYTQGKVYDVTPRLAEVFVKWGFAELDTGNESDENVATPEGTPVPETEDQRRAREAAAAGVQPSADLSIVDAEHYPDQGTAIAQARTTANAQAQDSAAAAVDFNNPRLTRAQLDEAAQAIGVDASNLQNKDAVRKAIAEAQGGN